MKAIILGDFQGVFPKKLKERLRKKDYDLIIGVGDYGGINEFRPYIRDLFIRLKKGMKRISPEEFFGKNKYKNMVKKDFKQTKNVLKKINALNKPFFSVFGNTDEDWYRHPVYKNKTKKEAINFIKKLKNMINITYGYKKFQDYNLIGFGGYMDIDAYFKKKTFKSEREKIAKKLKKHKKVGKIFFNLMKKADKKEVDKIFVFHYPPKGIFDIIKDKNNPMDGESAGVRYYSEAIKKYKPKLVLCGHMHEYQGMKKLYGVPVINPGDAGEGKYALIEIDDDTGKIKIKFSR